MNVWVKKFSSLQLQNWIHKFIYLYSKKHTMQLYKGDTMKLQTFRTFVPLGYYYTKLTLISSPYFPVPMLWAELHSSVLFIIWNVWQSKCFIVTANNSARVWSHIQIKKGPQL